ncbi:hypothetical protein FDECE_6316 [Fusarium decemcellulare]|nr:hypothetical protein FDECE_6316 [Fusarium decemcellulare]
MILVQTASMPVPAAVLRDALPGLQHNNEPPRLFSGTRHLNHLIQIHLIQEPLVQRTRVLAPVWRWEVSPLGEERWPLDWEYLEGSLTAFLNNPRWYTLPVTKPERPEVCDPVEDEVSRRETGSRNRGGCNHYFKTRLPQSRGWLPYGQSLYEEGQTLRDQSQLTESNQATTPLTPKTTLKFPYRHIQETPFLHRPRAKAASTTYASRDPYHGSAHTGSLLSKTAHQRRRYGRPGSQYYQTSKPQPGSVHPGIPSNTRSQSHNQYLPQASIFSTESARPRHIEARMDEGLPIPAIPPPPYERTPATRASSSQGLMPRWSVSASSNPNGPPPSPLSHHDFLQHTLGFQAEVQQGNGFQHSASPPVQQFTQKEVNQFLKRQKEERQKMKRRIKALRR